MTEENKMDKDWGHVNSLKDKLQMVTTEIDSIKNSFAKGAEDLARIQNMLDLGNLEEITTMIERYEGQVAEAEQKRMEAAEGAKKYSEELEKEKERLIKLWDAYKNQEEELSTTEKKIAEYEEQARMAESSKQQLEEDYTARINLLTQRIEENEEKIQKYDEYQGRVEDFDNVRNRLEGEIHTLKEESNNKDTTINNLQQQVNELKDYEKHSEYKGKYDELNTEYEKEKERLTKLYQLYEETDTECKRLKKENHNWQQWFNSNKEIFDKLFSAAPTYQTPTETKETTKVEVTPEPPTTDTPEDLRPERPKKKKKIRLKK
jgi:chromosome segregation ATPase